MEPSRALLLSSLLASLAVPGRGFTSVRLRVADEPGPIPREGGGTRVIDEDDPPDPPEERVTFTFPGTKWCGPGNVAESYHDLGKLDETDRCCRAHDYCDDVLPAGHTAHGLVNDDFYSKLSCDCDETFLACLRRSNEGSAETVGRLYFDVIGTQCFRLDFPIAKCAKRRGGLRKKCLEYEYDTSKPKIYQWFDVPPFVPQSASFE